MPSQKQVWNSIAPEKKSEQEIIDEIEKLLINSTKKTPPENFGVLLSGGLDSSLLTLLLKKLNRKFVCYVVEFYHPNFKQAEDIKYAKSLAKELDVNLKIVKVSLEDAEKVLPDVINIIKRDEVPMVSIALAVYFCMEQAQKDGLKLMLYDCSLDCLFAGLQKHRLSEDVNKACVKSLEKTYKVDFPRDCAIAKNFGIKLECPFLDNKLISFALNLDPKYKIKKGIEKYILRKTALKLGLKKEISFRKKRAIQYSSNSQKMIKKIAKQNEFKKIGDYIESLNKKEI